MSLPVDAVLPQVLEALAQHGAVVVQAPTGSGKTTRLPPAVARSRDGLVVVVEPRRVAARAAARRVAHEWGCKLGDEVGYQVRDDRKRSERTRVLFVTEGILLRWLIADPFVEHIGTVVLDEFHERSTQLDLCLALLQSAREAGAGLAVVAMSATLDAQPLAAFLDAPVVTSEGRLHPVTIDYAPRPSTDPIEDQVAAAVASLPDDGDVLVFLPGRAEIDRVCQRIPGALPLHGSLSSAEQDRVFDPGTSQRIIASTNVAESSVTVPGVRYVVDSGVARVPRLDPRTGLDQLDIEPIAKDSADQRAGRAGRLGPGHCVRLWTAADHRDRAAQTTPEIHRTDLAPTLLALMATGEPDPRAFRWFEAPEPHAIELGMELLEQLGAVDGGLTALGEQLAQLPLHPRLGRFLIEGHAHGATDLAARWATWLSDGGRPEGDLTQLQPPQSRTASRLVKQLGPPGRRDPSALARAAVAGWPDRVATQRGKGAVMANGLGVIGCKEPWFVAVGLHAARRGPRGEAMVTLYSPMEPDWLPSSEHFHTRLDGDRAVTVLQQLRGSLVLNEHPAPLDVQGAREVLLAEALRRGLQPKADAWDDLMYRMDHARAAGAQLPTRAEANALVLHQLCGRIRTLEALKHEDWVGPLLDRLDWNQRQALDRLAPRSIPIGSRTMKLAWTPEGPVLAARIQHLFGVTETPRVGGQPVLLHLLAPNGRPQQITRDLAGFWASTYFEVRKELRRRYPKHAWPDDPLQPPPRRR